MLMLQDVQWFHGVVGSHPYGFEHEILSYEQIELFTSFREKSYSFLSLSK